MGDRSQCLRRRSSIRGGGEKKKKLVPLKGGGGGYTSVSQWGGLLFSKLLDQEEGGPQSRSSVRERQAGEKGGDTVPFALSVKE